MSTEYTLFLSEDFVCFAPSIYGKKPTKKQLEIEAQEQKIFDDFALTDTDKNFISDLVLEAHKLGISPISRLRNP